MQERATHGRAMRLARQQASADLQMARDAWAHERRVGGLGQGGAVLGGAGPSLGSQTSIQQSMQQLMAENGRLHAAAAASQHRYESALTALHARDVALKALEATLVALQASTPPFPHSAATHPPPPTQPGPAAVMARQLVNAKLAEADLRRKLRVASRSEVALRDEIASRDARIRELRSGGGQSGGAGGGQGGGAHGSAGGSLGAAGSADFAPPPSPYLALTDAYAPTEAHWEMRSRHLNGSNAGESFERGLRAQLARMKEELEAARRELALERASGGGAGADVDWQGVQLSDDL